MDYQGGGGLTIATPRINEQLKQISARNADRARLLISCPDRPGIIAAVSQFLFANGANIIQSDQHTSNPSGLFFMRIEFEWPDVANRLSELEARFGAIADAYTMTSRFRLASVPQRIAVFVSKEDHCLLELLWQWEAGDLFADIAMVVSNHPDSEKIVSAYGIPFHYTPVSAETKPQVEQQQLALVSGHVDTIILARYMQILSPQFVAQHTNQIINIHHSFLPAFIGKNPYARAYNRGVKLIGATAHYVTADLDEGPIIEQNVQRVDHRNEAEDLKRIGRHVEREVLARAVKWHLEDRILIHGNKTVVFA